jgi:hypothetical protein
MNSGNRAGFITHEGKQVLVLDYTNCTPSEVTLLAEEAERIITGEPHNSVLVLSDFEGAHQPGRCHPHHGSGDPRSAFREACGMGTYQEPAQSPLRRYKDVFSTRVPYVRDTRGGIGVLGQGMSPLQELS